MTSELSDWSLKDWIVIVGVLAILCGGIWALPRVWKDQLASGGDHAPEWWPWGEALWQGYRRMFLPGLMVGGVFVIIIFMSLFVSEAPQGPFARPYWVVIPWLVALGLSGTAMLSTVLFNVPKFLVPPHLRGQPGAVAEWLRAWQRWRRYRRGAR